MTFEQLNYFVETYRQKSITKAAENLYVTRQALSLTIRKLEEELNVTLFFLSSNGITPTHAADALYSSAKKILNEKSIINQTMLNYSKKTDSMKVCKIGLGLAFTSICGEEILDSLSKSFPNTYFIVESFTLSQKKDFYKDFDITIFTIPDNDPNYFSPNIEPIYSIRTLAAYPRFVWISSNSPLASKEIINLSDLKNYQLSLLRNSYNELDYLNSSSFKSVKTFDIKKSFIDHIERFDFFTLDVEANYGKLLYEDFFANHKVCKKRIDSNFILKMIYKKDSVEDFCQVIANVLPY